MLHRRAVGAYEGFGVQNHKTQKNFSRNCFDDWVSKQFGFLSSEVLPEISRIRNLAGFWVFDGQERFLSKWFLREKAQNSICNSSLGSSDSVFLVNL